MTVGAWTAPEREPYADVRARIVPPVQPTHLTERLLAIEVSALCDADKTLPVLDPAIRAMVPDVRMAGPALHRASPRTTTCRCSARWPRPRRATCS